MTIKAAMDVKIDCTRCGACNSICPVYDLTRHERFSPRGKARLFSDLVRGEGLKRLSHKDLKLAETLSACLQCGACSSVCPAGVEVDAIVRRVRQGNPMSGLGFFSGLLKRPGLISRLAPLFSMVPRESGLILRLLGLSSAVSRGRGARFVMPQISSRPAIFRGLEGVKGRFGHLTNRPKIAFFLGCIQNYIYPEVAEAIARCLGGTLTVPVDQVCCGLPFWSSGLMDQARTLALRNLNAIQMAGSDVVITGCASCAAMMKRWPELFEDGPDKDAAVKVASMVKEFTEFVRDSGRVPGISERYSGLSMTYHAPCHQRFALGGAGAGIELLQQAAPRDFVPVSENCCGHGGVFSLKQAGLSRAILEKRLDVIKEKGVDLIVTTCSGCLLQFRTALPDEGNLRAVHIAELLSF